MLKFVAPIVILSLGSNPSNAATDGGNQAKSSANIDASLCLKHLNNLDALREKLKPMPKLPLEKAAHFLAGIAGDTWPVPGKHGIFVLALPSGKIFARCMYEGRTPRQQGSCLPISLITHHLRSW